MVSYFSIMFCIFFQPTLIVFHQTKLSSKQHKICLLKHWLSHILGTTQCTIILSTYVFLFIYIGMQLFWAHRWMRFVIFLLDDYNDNIISMMWIHIIYIITMRTCRYSQWIPCLCVCLHILNVWSLPHDPLEYGTHVWIWNHLFLYIGIFMGSDFMGFFCIPFSFLLLKGHIWNAIGDTLHVPHFSIEYFRCFYIRTCVLPII